jgi:small multidrug resistance pump
VRWLRRAFAPTADRIGGLTIYWLSLLGAISITVLGETLLKMGAASRSFLRQLIDWRTLAGVTFYGLAALLYMLALRRIPMSVATPYTAASYVAVALIGRFVFRESLGRFQIAGIGLIVAGTCLLTYGSL